MSYFVVFKLLRPIAPSSSHLTIEKETLSASPRSSEFNFASETATIKIKRIQVLGGGNCYTAYIFIPAGFASIAVHRN